MNSGRTVFAQLIERLPHQEFHKCGGLEVRLYQILQILSLRLFEKMPILCFLQAIKPGVIFAENANQLILFDF